MKEYDFSTFENVKISGIDMESLTDEELSVLFVQAKYCQAMTDADIDPKPENYVHKNGIKGISKVVYRTGKKNADALKHLVQDEILEVIEGDDTKIEAVEF